MFPFVRNGGSTATTVSGYAAEEMGPHQPFPYRSPSRYLTSKAPVTVSVLAFLGVGLSAMVGPVPPSQAARPVPATTSTSAPATTPSTASTTTTTSTTSTSTTAAPTAVTTRTAAPAPSQVKAPAPAAATGTGLVGRAGRQLKLGGAPYVFAGLNAYELATLNGANAGCGPPTSDADLAAFFGTLPANSVVRMWAWQGSMATDPNTHQRNWTALDRVVAAARTHQQKLILALSGQSGGCDDGHWKDRSWYNGGYRQVFNDDGRGLAIASYWSWVDEIVTRYAGDPTIAMWEPVSEPEASDCPAGLTGAACEGHQVCPSEAAAADALRSFFDTVGGEIHRLDPAHLVESGALGSGQCGMVWTDYQTVHASAGIDVASVHDYGADTVALPGDQWNGEQERLTQAAALDKPIIVGEMGIRASDTASGCTSTATRASELQHKIDAARSAGFSGTAVWDWLPSTAPDGGCTYDVKPGDPFLNRLGA